ncbi:SOS response-associated peptidase [Sphingomonas sp. 3-13AW]|uniref:SOS response-associated peptidase n=1 Tax=Sphingomonas sp. 3-13AW TaxID=3050450 RepID=UPI003BB4E000
MTLSLSVLEEAAARPSNENVATTSVRLALRILMRVLPRRQPLDQFWRIAQLPAADRPAWENCTSAYNDIRYAMIAAGWDVAELDAPWKGWDMCNRYRMTARQAELATRYGVEMPYLPDITIPAPELFPKRAAWVVKPASVDGGRDLTSMLWGFPRTVMGARGKPVETSVTNVRNLESPFWRTALSRPMQRCLVPVTSFSEYGPGPKGARPLWWFDVPSRPIFSFAGIWREAQGRAVFAFLTTEPNTIVAPIHPKAMPLILHEEDEERWLRGELGDLVAPFPSQLMTVRQDPSPKGETSQAETG